MIEFPVIAVTRPEIFESEGERIINIIKEHSASLIHIRKPGSSRGELERLIVKIPCEYHHFITLHDHFDLLQRYPLIGGIHLNSRFYKIPDNLEIPKFNNNSFRISCSIHTEEDIKKLMSGSLYALPVELWDYVTISPVFPSISKFNYYPSIPFDEWRRINSTYPLRLVALGGITPDKKDILSDVGFYGCAMLGHFFPR